MTAPLYSFTSHIDGRNATVNVFIDRVEWERPRSISKGKMFGAVATLGMSAVAGVKNNKTGGSEMIALKAITSVTMVRDGMMWTKISVIASGNTIDFRVTKGSADEIKGVLTQLVLGTHPAQTVTAATAAPVNAPAAPVAQPAPGGQSVPERLSQLDALLGQGYISADEHSARRAAILSSI